MGETVMLVNVLEEEEARIAVVEDNRLQEFYLERTSREQIVGNIYKARVINVEPSIEAAFVDFSYERHGFLHASDVKSSASGRRDKGGRDDDDRERNRNIRKLLRPGDEILVQVTKEGIGEKGPALTTYLSIPGRYLVLMPGMSLRGVSRRIEDPKERRRVRSILKDLTVPDGVGIIARTAGEEREPREFQRDLDYLGRLWEAVRKRADSTKAPALIYQESDQVIRVIRDVFHEDVRKVYVDSPGVYERVREFMRDVMPHHVRKAKLYEEEQPMFERFGVEKELERMNSRLVELECGGSIVLEQTEALVAIDVNSGHFRGSRDAEESAFRLNMEAVDEIVRQIKLRDLGGVIVIDFIDMPARTHRTKVEEKLQGLMEQDKARFRMLKMSPFCIVEMTRQRRRRSLHQTVYVECPTCKGAGTIKSPETMALEVIRKVRTGLQRDEVARADVDVQPAVANHLVNTMRLRLRQLETEFGKEIQIHADPARRPEENEIRFRKQDGAQVKV